MKKHKHFMRHPLLQWKHKELNLQKQSKKGKMHLLKKNSNEKSYFPVVLWNAYNSHFLQMCSWDLYLEHSEINHESIGY